MSLKSNETTRERPTFLIERAGEDRLDVVGVGDDDAHGGGGDVGGLAVVADLHQHLVLSRPAGVVPVLELQQLHGARYLAHLQRVGRYGDRTANTEVPASSCTTPVSWPTANTVITASSSTTPVILPTFRVSDATGTEQRTQR